MPQINLRQFTILVIFFTVGSSVLFAPSQLVGLAKQDGWIAGLLGLGAGLLLVNLIVSLMEEAPGKSIIELTLWAMGPFFGRVISAFFLFFLVILSCFLLGDMGMFWVTQIMAETPILALYIVFALVGLLASYYGIEAIARVSELLFPGILFLILFLFLFLLPHIGLDNLMPFFEKGWKPITLATLNFYALPFNDLIIFMMVIPYLQEQKGVRKAMVTGATFGGVILLLFVLFSLWVLGPDYTASTTFASYMLAQKIVVGQFLTRIEVMIALIWMVTLFMKLALVMFSLFSGLHQLLQLQSRETLSLPITLFIVVLTPIMIPSLNDLANFAQYKWWAYGISIGTLYPLLVLILYKVKSKRLKKEDLRYE